MSRETVRSATLRPSFRSSPWIRGAAQSGLALAIRVIKALSSASTVGRPPVGRAESLVQYSRKRRRCHRKTVSGDTMMRACLQPGQTLASTTQNMRSVVQSLGRGTARLYTASCWRRVRFSKGELTMAAEEEGKDPKQVEQEGDHRTAIVAGLVPADQPLTRRMGFWRRTGEPGRRVMSYPVTEPVPDSRVT